VTHAAGEAHASRPSSEILQTCRIFSTATRFTLRRADGAWIIARHHPGGMLGGLRTAAARAESGPTRHARRGGGAHAPVALPPANTDIATLQALELVGQHLQASTWEVVAGTAVQLSVAMAGTMVGGAAVLLQMLERTSGPRGGASRLESYIFAAQQAGR
jgi:hypothetical protein